MNKPFASADLNREDFRAWLLAQPARAVVGYADSPSECPLARWIAAGTGRSCIIHTETYRCPKLATPVRLPDWALGFSLLLDYSYLTKYRGRLIVNRPVIREEALALLKQLS